VSRAAAKAGVAAVTQQAELKAFEVLASAVAQKGRSLIRKSNVVTSLGINQSVASKLDEWISNKEVDEILIHFHKSVEEITAAKGNQRIVILGMLGPIVVGLIVGSAIGKT
jgi:hypothetical protein